MLKSSAESPVQAEPHAHVSRLLQGMATMVVEKAFADITVADIVRAAGVSKRSFYEHFDSKEACFLALYSAASASALRTLSDAVAPDQPWHHQIERGLHAYLGHLAGGQGLLRALFIDIHYLGEEGAMARREVMQRVANFMLETVNASPAEDQISAFSPTLAMAAVGGINELILQAIETGRLDHLTELTVPASNLVRLLTGVAPKCATKNPAR